MSEGPENEVVRGARILVIDDEVQIRRFLRISLVSQGYEVIEASTGEEGLDHAARRSPDLIVLDLGLPGMDGKGVLSELRSWSAVPVLILSVRADEGEKVKALDVGANDYVTKPFGLQEFLARVRSLLRARLAAGTPTAIYDDGFLRVDIYRRQISVAGENVRLTRREFDLLKMLFAHKDRVVTQT
jgi:two-component system KDP operon response regulator KdpE